MFERIKAMWHALKKDDAFLDQVNGVAVGLATLIMIVVLSVVVIAKFGQTSIVTGDANATAYLNTLKGNYDTVVDFVGILILVALAGLVFMGLTWFRAKRD